MQQQEISMKDFQIVNCQNKRLQDSRANIREQKEKEGRSYHHIYLNQNKIAMQFCPSMHHFVE